MTSMHKTNEKAETLSTSVTSSFTTQADDAVINAECLFANFICEHNFSCNTADCFIRLCKEMFPDSKIAKKLHCGSTKTAQIVKESLAPVVKEEVVEHCQNQSFSLSCDESNDSKEEKSLAILVSSGVAPGEVRKRQDYLEWSEYFMAVAFLSAQRSKDPSSQVGACIVNQENKIVGIGYNGMPNGCDDDLLPWARSAEDRLDTKYPYVSNQTGRLRLRKHQLINDASPITSGDTLRKTTVVRRNVSVCHAEMNAIMNKNSADVKGCTMYVALFPCNECAKLIIQSGIKDVVYLSDKYHNTPEMEASRRLLDMARIPYRQFQPKRNKIVIDFDSIGRSVQHECNGGGGSAETPNNKN
ncbi:deoxycytidylate deaminase isoform X2 [Neoarius graeffei]|uniref:deoxycytidylate deaminase isoform X2 n=1 Tax=Neoarius graeffei TaxID=443677 RepID=UPI00298BEC31|nr:deoxycytidylate deaminase isoform X2 [Neoarius graeffei]